jgi:hypothetical protein
MKISKNLEVIPIAEPFLWYKKQSAPYVIFFSFGQSDGDLIKIFHGENPHSEKLSHEIKQTLGQKLKREKLKFGKVKSKGEHSKCVPRTFHINRSSYSIFEFHHSRFRKSKEFIG